MPGVKITGAIAPKNTTDTYPTHWDYKQYRGWRVVIDMTERDSIPLLMRSQGMEVKVLFKTRSI